MSRTVAGLPALLHSKGSGSSCARLAFATVRRPQTFFATTACSIALSRLRSATIYFSFLFSSSSWRSRRNSDGPMPLYFYFQT